MTIEDLAPNRGQRMMVCGKTGSGKTYLSRRAMQLFPRVVLCDSKGEFSRLPRDEWQRIRSLSDLPHASKARLLVTIPAGEFEDWDALFQWAWKQGGLCLYVDETNHVVRGTDPGYGLRNVLTTGRTRGVSAIICTQRPVGIPVIVRSETERYAVFRLQTMDDREYMSDIINDGKLLPQPPRYAFWYRGPDDDKPSLYRMTEEGHARSI